MPQQRAQPADGLLVAVMNGNRVLDAGSGVLICDNRTEDGWESYVLTCRHNLRALRQKSDGSSDSEILVNGATAEFIPDPDNLEKYDLAILKVKGNKKIGSTPRWNRALDGGAALSSAGFVGFFGREFQLRTVSPLKCEEFRITTGRGLLINYLKLTGKGPWFDKGMSGGPVYNSRGELIAIARIVEIGEKEPRDKNSSGRSDKSLGTAYAIRLTDDIISTVEQLCRCKLSEAAESSSETPAADTPPPPEPPKQESIEADDIQKNRWGGSPRSGPFELHIENVRKYARYFLFDVVVTSDKENELVSPFIFYLHDTYKPGVIWVRKTDGKRAGLFDIGSNGVFTIGLQFRSANHGWVKLEYDLAKFQKGELRKKYRA